MTIENVLLEKTIKILELENEVMRILSTKSGFYALYTSSMWKYKKDAKACFDYCNNYYKRVFGDFYYLSFEDFQKHHQINLVSAPVNSLQVLEREYLLTWFKSKGFNSWTSFKALVMHYYPLTSENVLYEFWQSKSFDAETQKNVGYVKQIIGE